MRRTRCPSSRHGEHCSVYDTNGKKYFDALSGLFCTQIGYSFGAELGEAAAKQMAELPFYTNWNYAHPRSVELAGKVAELAPGDLNRIFFVSGGSEANEAIIKLVKQYHQFKGFRNRYKMIARRIAYHGTTLRRALAHGRRAAAHAVRAAHAGRAARFEHEQLPPPAGRDRGRVHAVPARRAARRRSSRRRPTTVAAVFIEPVQNSGGTFTPPEGYCRGVREICDEYGILLVADEVICGFGRLGYWFGSERYDIRPDIITFAKGIGSAHVPLGGVLMTDAVAAPFIEGTNMFNHGITYGGHPVSCAVALKNLEVMEREGVLENVRQNEDYFRGILKKLGEKPIVGDVRGAGYFMSLELVKDKETKETFTDAEAEYLLRGFVSRRVYEAGLICRADDRGDPVIQLSPPLVATRDDLDFIHDVLDTVLDDAWVEMTKSGARQAVSS